MTPEQFEQDIRAFVGRYSDMPTSERIDGPLFVAYVQARYLLRIIDDLRHALAHTPAPKSRPIYVFSKSTRLPAAPTIPPPREPPHFHGGTRPGE